MEADLGRPLSASEALRADALLAKASALVIGYAGQDFEPGPYPETVSIVTAGMVARVLEVGETALANVEQQANGPFSVKYVSGSTSSAVWLSAADKLMLRPHRLAGGLTSIALVGDRYKRTEDTY